MQTGHYLIPQANKAAPLLNPALDDCHLLPIQNGLLDRSGGKVNAESFCDLENLWWGSKMKQQIHI